MITETSRRAKKDGTFRVWFRCTDCEMYGAGTTDDVDDFLATWDEIHTRHCRRAVVQLPVATSGGGS